MVYVRSNGSVTNKRTNKTAPLKPLDAEPVDVDGADDPRQRLADWMADPKNPFFARAVANRYWAHFFGRGIVDPIDDLRVTNPAVEPRTPGRTREVARRFEVLAEVAREDDLQKPDLFAQREPDRVQQDRQAIIRSLLPEAARGEVVFDAVCKLTDSPSQFGGLPADRNAPQRAIMLPDESFTSYFLDVFGRPQRSAPASAKG